MRLFIFGLLLAISYAQTAYMIPCIYGTNKPAGCAQRIKPCSSFSASEVAGLKVVESDTNYVCSQTTPKLRDTLFTGPTNTYFVKFTSSEDKCYGIIMQGGECWGKRPNTGASYDCQGRCGAGCRHTNLVTSNWARDCLKHDVCSWYFGASGGGSDPNCGDEYNDAFNDWLRVNLACTSTGDSCGSAGEWYEKTKRRACYKDECKGTWSNPLPRGQQWVRLRQASEKGCCRWNGAACDWCAPPYPGFEEESESEVSDAMDMGVSDYPVPEGAVLCEGFPSEAYCDCDPNSDCADTSSRVCSCAEAQECCGKPDGGEGKDEGSSDLGGEGKEEGSSDLESDSSDAMESVPESAVLCPGFPSEAYCDCDPNSDCADTSSDLGVCSCADAQKCCSKLDSSKVKRSSNLEQAVALDGLKLENERLKKANMILRQTLETMEMETN